MSAREAKLLKKAINATGPTVKEGMPAPTVKEAIDAISDRDRRRRRATDIVVQRRRGARKAGAITATGEPPGDLQVRLGPLSDLARGRWRGHGHT